MKLKLGMIGGGKDAFIGAVHRIALGIDGQIELVAAALSSNPETAISSGKNLYLNESRIYTDYK
ncbi:MAG: gfo/Idh/MocA family oxidoreductase, partial [Ferruginibacter sp.]